TEGHRLDGWRGGVAPPRERDAPSPAGEDAGVPLSPHRVLPSIGSVGAHSVRPPCAEAGRTPCAPTGEMSSEALYLARSVAIAPSRFRSSRSNSVASAGNSFRVILPSPLRSYCANCRSNCARCDADQAVFRAVFFTAKAAGAVATTSVSAIAVISFFI